MPQRKRLSEPQRRVLSALANGATTKRARLPDGSWLDRLVILSACGSQIGVCEYATWSALNRRDLVRWEHGNPDNLWLENLVITAAGRAAIGATDGSSAAQIREES